MSVLKKNQEKSALQSMSLEDEEEDDLSDSENDEKYMEQNNYMMMTEEQLRLDESIRNRGPTISETVITAINIEQEWDDFDEVWWIYDGHTLYLQTQEHHIDRS